MVEEQTLVLCIHLHQIHRSLHIPTQQHLIGSQKPSPLHQELEVGVVESPRGRKVERGQVAIASDFRANRLEPIVVAPLEGHVRFVFPVLVVEPLPERHASRHSYGVPAYTKERTIMFRYYFS